VLLTLAYATGAAVPLLAIAVAGRSAADRLRARAGVVRFVAGGLVAGAALAIALGVDQRLQTRVPGYTESIQNRFERSEHAQRELTRLTGARAPTPVSPTVHDGQARAVSLPNYGGAPEFREIDGWLNSRPLTLAGLRGRVVLIDFWTYSCINCLRTLPFVRDWDARYRAAGLTIVGVHTPEFAFEREHGNVRENTRRLAIRYPVAIDNGFGTWNAWRNQYWPAKYLIDRRGDVRYYHFGEGQYEETEQAIRQLLAERTDTLPAPSRLQDRTPRGRRTAESYLGYERIRLYRGPELRHDVEATYAFPASLGQDELAFSGSLRVERERIVAVRDARLRLEYYARKVHLVLGGRGDVRVLVDGRPERVVRVRGDRLYTLVERRSRGVHLLELAFDPGVEAYAFTFG
jgi:thiol-disulfide isomerase/thioredoxin